MHRSHPLPAEVYSLVEQTPAAVLLESDPARDPNASSFLFLEPAHVLAPRTPRELAELFVQIDQAAARGWFAAGYFAYECGVCFEPSARIHPPRGDRPLAWFGLYPRRYTFDHAAAGFIDGDPPGLRPAAASAAALDPRPDVSASLGAPEYCAQLEQIREFIRAGDVYQLNFTFPLHLRVSAGAAALYARLRAAQPVQYGAFVHEGEGRSILSFSPELFFRVDNEQGSRRITTRPMKGTAPRGRTTAEDRGIAHALAGDAKNRSENVMIVDLLRNDLGRLCEFGTVEVKDLFAVERHDTLWQMTSTVTGILRGDAGYAAMVRALFPCGSVTGAPKVRAMQLLAGLEAAPRGVYAGAIGYFSRERTVFNVAIRTLEIEGAAARMGVGSGVVIDSVPELEYRECLLKAEFLTRPPAEFDLVETLLWDGGYPLLDRHLDRLEDSADYFAFAFDRDHVRAALANAALAFAAQPPRRVRLLLSRGGNTRIEAAPLAGVAAAPLRLCVAVQPTDPSDRFLYHKTTHRPAYSAALAAAQQAGFDDALFLNRNGHVTETALGNVWTVRGGRWTTPPLECGLLAGVYRAHLLDVHPEFEQRVLTLEHLRSADALYVSNAVRGLRPAVLAADPLAS